MSDYNKDENFFDPRIIEENKSNRVWSSKSVELALSATKQGIRLRENPFFQKSKDVLLRTANLPYEYTDEEMEILGMIQGDVLLWAKNFPSLKDGANGWRKIKLRDYQVSLLKRYEDNLKNILLFPRQAGKTTTTVLDITHFAITNYDKDMIIVANSDDVVEEILKKVKECFGSLPFYMQPGVVSWTSEGFVLDNGVRLRAKKASESVSQGFAVDYLFVDEFAYIDKKVVQKFWTNIYPTLSANPSSKCVIASTPNGRNLFHTLWSNAIAKKSTFVPYKIHWTDVPRPDQEAYKREVIADVGLTAWLMGFELSFDTSIVSVFDVKVQKLLRERQTKYQKCWSHENNPKGYEWDMSFRNPETITSIVDENEITVEGVPLDFENDYFVASIDLAEGLGQDSTILKLRKCVWCTEKKRIEYKVVGIYKRNDISVEDFATHSVRIIKSIKNIRVALETNTYGSEYMLQIKHLITSKAVTDFDQFVFARFMDYNENATDSLAKNNYKIGVKWNKGNKPVAVKSYVENIKSGIFDETNNDTIEEQLNFGKSENGTYSAQYGHDDMVMADVTMAFWLASNSMWVNDYLELAETYLRFINNDRKQEIIDEENRIKELEANIYRIAEWERRDHQKELDENNRDNACYL